MAPIVVLLLQLVSNDCSLPGLSSLGLRPALTFGVVGRVAARVLKGKPAGFCVGTTSFRGGEGNPSGARRKLRPQGVRMEFHLGFAAHVVGVIVDHWLCFVLQREDFVKLGEVWNCSRGSSGDES